MVTSAETSFGSIWRKTTSEAPPQPDEFSQNWYARQDSNLRRSA